MTHALTPLCNVAYTRYNVYVVVFMRLRQLQGGKLTAKAAATVQIAVVVYFSIWHGFPVLWLLLEFRLIGHPVSLCMHTVLDVVAKSFYGFVLLSFQLTCEREEYIFLPLAPAIPEDDNVSEGEGSDADVELGYTLSEGGFKPSYVPKGPVVGSSKQRKMSREIMSAAREQEMEARSNGSRSRSPVYTPRGYSSSSPIPPVMSGGQDESAILRQIQALNSQLNDMVDDGRRAI